MDANQATALKQNLAANVNGNVQISSYCSSVTNTKLQPSDGAWYAPFMTNLATAQGHATLYLNTIGPDAWTTIPNSIVKYGQTYTTSMQYVQGILNAAGANELTSTQITEIQEIFEGLVANLTSLLGTSTDTNLSVNGAPPPTQPTIYGCLNDLKTFDNDITTDNQNLTSGQNGAAQEVALLEADETNMKTDIANLTAEIQTYSNDVAYSEMGIGVSIFVAVVGIALAVPTGGVSLVATGVGIAGLGASIATTVVYSDKVKDAQNQCAKDQAELTADQQQVIQLNAIISALTSLGTKNQAAQTALEGTVDTYTTLVSDAQTTITDMNGADSGTVKGIMENIQIQESVTAWNDLVTFAQGILGMSTNTQVLTPPNPTTN